MSFPIYQKGLWRNIKQLNSAGVMFVQTINTLLLIPAFQSDFKKFDSIWVNQLDHQGLPYSAIDITVGAAINNIILWDWLKNSRYTSFISSYNQHIHFDLRTDGNHGIEVLHRNKKEIYFYNNKAMKFNPMSDIISIENPNFSTDTIGNIKLKYILMYTYSGLSSISEEASELERASSILGFTFDDFKDFLKSIGQLPSATGFLKYYGEEIKKAASSAYSFGKYLLVAAVIIGGAILYRKLKK